LKQASLASVHEKNVRHGHISTLHIWTARRPLAACRAALLATLLPDPGDPEKRQALLDKIGGKPTVKLIKTIDEDGTVVNEEKETLEGGVLAWGQEKDPAMEEFKRMIQQQFGDRNPNILDPFAGGGAIPLEALRLGCEVTASDINPVAWLILKCTLSYPQQFAGKKWPLPDFVRDWPDFIDDFLAGKYKKRKGKAKPHFSEPSQPILKDDTAQCQSAIDNEAADVFLPEAELAWHVRAWGRWVDERSRADLSSLYPITDGEPTVAYLWARTARDKVEPYGRIPLLKTFWLCKKKGRRIAILPIPKPDRSGVDFGLLDENYLSNRMSKLLDDYPHLKNWDISAENLNEFLNKGTMNRAGVWSPCTGRPGLIALSMDDLRRQGQQGLLSAQMTSVVVEATALSRKKTYKKYRLPTKEEFEASHVEHETLMAAFADIPFGLPEEPLPPVGTLGFRIPLYGFKKWRDLFTARQLLSLAVFVKHTRRAIEEIARAKQEDSQSKAEAVGAMLMIAISRLVGMSTNLCRWENKSEFVCQVYARFALPMLWDYAEINPNSQTTGNYMGGIDWIVRYIEHASFKAHQVIISRQSAISPQYKSKYDVVMTDPPYYNAIPYSDLMDIFFLWLRRTLWDEVKPYESFFAEPMSPKWDHQHHDGELIQDESRFGGDVEKAKKVYEDGLARSFKLSLDSLINDGRMIVVFANKDVSAWETLISGLIRSGAIVTASWPIQTEREARSRSHGSAALASSVWIVCRNRTETALAGWEEDVLGQMKQKLFSSRETLGGRNILQYYFDLGIRGPDFMWAALGPALEAYSAYPFVKKLAGGIMTVPDFLKEVRRLVLQFSLGELPGFRELQQKTLGRGDTIELDPVTQYYLLHRAYFGLEPAPAGACILYANACGKNESELRIVWNILEQGGKSKRGRPSSEETEDMYDEIDSKGNQFRLLRWQERVVRENLGESRAGMTAPLIDRLHRMMFLFQQNRVSEVQQSFDTWGLASERAFPPLLQAVRELALRDEQDTERRLVEALATQLKMSKRTVIVDNIPTEVSLFENTELGA